MFLAALFTIAKIWKQPKCTSTYERIRKMWYIYICTGVLVSHKKVLVCFFSPFATTWRIICLVK